MRQRSPSARRIVAVAGVLYTLNYPINPYEGFGLTVKAFTDHHPRRHRQPARRVAGRHLPRCCRSADRLLLDVRLGARPEHHAAARHPDCVPERIAVAESDVMAARPAAGLSDHGRRPRRRRARAGVWGRLSHDLPVHAALRLHRRAKLGLAARRGRLRQSRALHLFRSRRLRVRSCERQRHAGRPVASWWPRSLPARWARC